MPRMPVVALLFAGALAVQVAAQSGVQVPRTLPPFHPEVDRVNAAGVKAPNPTVRQEAKYTSAAMRAKIEGQVVLDVLVDALGEVSDVRVAESLDADLDANAITAVKTWRFTPATRDGEAIPVVVPVVMLFRLH